MQCKDNIGWSKGKLKQGGKKVMWLLCNVRGEDGDETA